MKVSEGKHATINTRQVLDFGMRSTLADEYGETNVTIMDECHSPVNIALGLTKRSPLRFVFHITFHLGRENSQQSRSWQDAS